MSKRGSLVFIVSLFIISFLFPFFFFSRSVQAITSDLRFEFDGDYIFNSDNFSYTEFNLKNQSFYTQYYNATYDFNNDVIGSNPIGWVINLDNVEIISQIGNHNKVMKIWSQGAMQYAKAYNYFSSPQSTGIVEMWYRCEDLEDYNYINIQPYGVRTYRIEGSNTFKYLNRTGSWNTLWEGVITDIWYHIKIDFNCITDTFDWYVNGILIGNDLQFSQVQDDLSFLDLDSYSTDLDIYGCYFDAIGYSWDLDYSILNNAVPYMDINPLITEVDKCEFAYNLTTYEPNTVSSLIIDNNWIENDDGTDAHVKTGIYHEIEVDYLIAQAQNTYGIYKEFGYDTSNKFNVVFNITSMSLFNPHNDGWHFKIYSYDDTLLVDLLFQSDGLDIYIYYYNGSGYEELHELASVLGAVLLDVYIDAFCVLSLSSPLDDEVFYFPKLTDNVGINTIEIVGGDDDDIGDLASIMIDAVGLYVNGTSYMVDDLSSIIVSTDIEQWDDSYHNLIEVTGDGYLSFSVFYNDVLAEVFFNLTEFDDELKRVKYLDSNIFEGADPYTFVILSNSSFFVSKISVYAIVLIEGVNEYIPSYIDTNVNNETDYFYISGNSLYCSVIFDSVDFEGCMMTFDVDNFEVRNASMNYYSYYGGTDKPYFVFDYLSSAEDGYYVFSSGGKQKFILPQTLILDKIIINFTDYIPFFDGNYTNTEEGYIFGYLGDIYLQYLPSIDFTITLTAMIFGFIPLLITLVVTVGMREALPDKSKNKIVLPGLIFMSIICVVAQLIPLWLFSLSLLIFGFLAIFSRRGVSNSE